MFEKIISGLVWFWSNYGSWVMASLIPSIIVGLTASPKTSKWADKLKILLQILSVLTHKDAPGTFKKPFTTQKTLNGVNKVGPGMQKIIALILCFTLAGCATLKGIFFSPEMIQCGIEAVKKEVTNLYGTVLAILSGGAPDWDKQLKALEQVGKEAVLCAIAVVAQDLRDGKGTGLTADSKMLAVARADQYLKASGEVLK